MRKRRSTRLVRLNRNITSKPDFGSMRNRGGKTFSLQASPMHIHAPITITNQSFKRATNYIWLDIKSNSKVVLLQVYKHDNVRVFF